MRGFRHEVAGKIRRLRLAVFGVAILAVGSALAAAAVGVRVDRGFDGVHRAWSVYDAGAEATGYSHGCPNSSDDVPSKRADGVGTYANT